jgi:cholesterol transport system auxiliary component
MRTILFIAVLLAISGCSSKQPSLKVYTLHAQATHVSYHKYRKHKTIRVSYSRSIKEKASYKMRYSYSASEQGTYQNSQWSNNLGRLLQGVLIESLARSHMFKAVLPYTSTLREDYRLESSIFDFSHHIRGKSSYAIVSIQFNLIDIGTGRLLKSKRFTYREPTVTTDAKGYVEATNRIMTKLSQELLRWL